MRVRVNVKEMGIKDRLADLEAIIWGDNLHAPLIERLLELPMDIYTGVCPAMTYWFLPRPCLHSGQGSSQHFVLTLVVHTSLTHMLYQS